MDQMPENPEKLQFDKAEIDETAAGGFCCHFCERQIHHFYFEINGRPACESCRYQAESLRASGSGMGRFIRALVAGSAGGVVGAGIYYAVLALTGYQVGLVAIAVGLLVGFAVRWGCRGRGGWMYQGMAMALTYVAIVSTYVPLIFEEIRKQEVAAEVEARAGQEAATEAAGTQATATEEKQVTSLEGSSTSATSDTEPVLTPLQVLSALLLFFLLVLAIPFLGGLENIIGIVIIGIGVYEAWKINRRQPWIVEGPFGVGSKGSAESG